MILPLIGALIVFLFFGNDEISQKKQKIISLTFSIINLLLASLIFIYVAFNKLQDGQYFQLVENVCWFNQCKINYKLAIDGFSWLFVFLTTLLIPICILCSWSSIQIRLKGFLVSFMILESLIIGAFLAQDLILFYIFFEAILIPMYFIIGIWGGEDRIYASIKFFLYTLVGSILFMIVVLYLYNHFDTADMFVLYDKAKTLPFEVQKYLWIATFFAFAVKIPMWPLHTWLPDAHVQAPTAGSVILAGVLLKLGGYGFIRFSLIMFPEASQHFSNLILILSTIAIIYASLVAFAQTNIKKLIAFSSIAHMGYVTAGIFSFNKYGVDGAIFQMFSHGIVSAALFLVVGVLYERVNTKEVSQFGGCASKMPIFAGFYLIFTLSSAGLPGTSGFIGEFLPLLGVFKINKLHSFLGATGMVLGAIYLLNLYRKIMFGQVSPKCNKIKDLSSIEVIYLLPLVFITIFIGIYSESITSTFDAYTSMILSGK